MKKVILFISLLLLCIMGIDVAYSQARKKAKTTCPYSNQAKQTSSCPYSNSSQTDLSTQSLFDEVNYARQNPKEYANILQQRLGSYSGGGKTTCKEAIAFLKKQPGRKAYTFSRALGQAAFDHCKDMSDKNFFGHSGSNGSNPTDRIAKYANCGTWAENISVGSMTARDVVVEWTIDHSVSNRGHRKAIFSDEYVYLGIAWCTHPSWRVSVTADFAPANFRSNMKDDNVIFEYVTMGVK